MTPQEILARVTTIMTERLGIAAADITPAARLVEDLGMDSLDAVELAIATERGFGVEVLEEELARLQTVDDVLRLIARELAKGAESHGP